MPTTDLNLIVEQILKYYSPRWKIEPDFKELKHDISSQKLQSRLEHSAKNHLNMCMLSIIVNPENICKNDMMSNKKCHHIAKILEIL